MSCGRLSHDKINYHSLKTVPFAIPCGMQMKEVVDESAKADSLHRTGRKLQHRDTATDVSLETRVDKGDVIRL